MTPEVRTQPAYKMIQALNIENYRCFKSIDLSGLPSVSVIVGANGSGKTSFLETMFLAGGTSPEIFLRTLSFRGAGDQIQIANNRVSYRAVWDELFHHFDSSKRARIQFIDSNYGERWLRVEYAEPEDLQLSLDQPLPSEFASVQPLQFVRMGPSGKEHVSRVVLTEKGLRMEQFPETFPIIFLPPKPIYSPADTTQRYSELSKQKKDGPILNALRDLFPHIEGLSVELHLGQSIVFADIHGMERRMPLYSMSAGAYKYLAFLVAIASQEYGVVLIDEIENGLFYAKLEKAWRGVIGLAKANNTQLFVSTHSAECLRALMPLLGEDEDAFALLRMERDWDAGVTSVGKIDGHKLEAALENGLEVR